MILQNKRDVRHSHLIFQKWLIVVQNFVDLIDKLQVALIVGIGMVWMVSNMTILGFEDYL